MTRALLATLWQGDSAFPSGGFAFSNGVEGAAMLAGPIDAERLGALLVSTMSHRWATSDRLALLHAHRAEDLGRLVEIDHALEAATPAEPLRLGSRRNGGAFLTSHERIGSRGAAAFRAEVVGGRSPGHLAVAQGWIWRRLGLDEAAAVGTGAYGCAAALVAAAVRLGAVGAIEAQRILAGTLDAIADLVDQPLDPNAALVFQSFAPWLEIATIRHARSDQRLFSN